MERFVETIKVLDGQLCNLEAHERRKGGRLRIFGENPLRGRLEK